MALEANPNLAQYWLSYIDALIKLERIDEAKAVFDQAQSKGVTDERFVQIAQRLGEFDKSFLDSKDLEESQDNILNELKLDQALKLAKEKMKSGLGVEAKKISRYFK